MNIITGYRGEPHITSAQDRAQNQGTYGTGSYILDVGQKLAATTVSANEIRIRDGVLSHQGCIANIEQGAYDSLEISNGTQGMSRIDLIVARYTKDAETNIEEMELVVIEGTPAASSPAVPSYNTGDIQAGDSPVDMPLYRVNITGINISSVTQVASAVRTQAETDTLLGNTSISGIGGGTLTGAVSALNSKIGNTAMGTTATTLTGAIAEHESDISTLNSNINALKYAEYEHKTFNAVTNTYSSNNILTFGEAIINGNNFANGAFLVILNASATTGRSTAYLVILGANATAFSYWMIANSDENYHPLIAATTGGSPYIYWSAALTATINASIFKLS